QVDVVVYPNPTKDVVNVQCTMNNVQCSGIEIVDVYGKIITTVGTRFIASADSPASAQSPVQINVSGLAAGMYFVRVTTDRGVVTKPFVKR
ncbi:MAG: T9SS type A sorting domain-containing protein, partial [Bacteroidales bacterium]|nr:T9SS type A sorting domain-containing protein [Bacteroidales bacterium]